MKRIITIAFIICLALSLFSQEQKEFKIGALIGVGTETGEYLGTYDLNIVGAYDKIVLSIGHLMDGKGRGFGFRGTAGARLYEDLTIVASYGIVDNYVKSKSSYGLEIGYRVYNNIHLVGGVETARGTRIGIMYLKK